MAVISAMSYDFPADFFANDSSHINSTDFIPDPLTTPCEINPLSPTVALGLCFILIIIFLLAIPGNLLVGWVISTSQHAATPSDVYLFHLTIADFLMALTIPFSAVVAIQGWIFGDFMCKLVSLIFDINFYTSILFLACISIDRYVVIVHARETLKSRQRICSKMICGAVWVLGCALALPAFFNDAFKPDKDKEFLICCETFDIGDASSWRFTIRAFRHIFGFLLPLSVMLTAYSITIGRLLHTRGFQKHRAMKVIIVVVIVFLLCWMPFHLTMMVDTLLRAELIPFDCAMRRSVDKALAFTSSMALLHSCINPVLYAFVGEKFRKKTKLLLQRRFRQERMSGIKFSRSTSQISDGSQAVF